MAQRSHRLDRERADRVFGSILAAYRAGSFPFSRPAVVVPNTGRHLPPGLQPGSLEHARLLFYFCGYMKGGIESATAIRSLGQLFLAHQELFDPEQAARDMDEYVSTHTVRQMQEDLEKNFPELLKALKER